MSFPHQQHNEVDFTVAIPTYNGAQRLPAVFEKLRSQQGIAHLHWELLVVDNNSTDDTAIIVRHYQPQLTPNCTVRYICETRQGAAYARKAAVHHAQSELIGFLDDDNHPDPHWIAAAYAFAQQHPQVGAYGSHIDGHYEVPPPPEFGRIQPFLAITNLGTEPRPYWRHQRLLPPSAGLVVRKQAWLESSPKRAILTGRTKTSMLTGEDLEVLAHFQCHNWEVWHNPAMRIVHQIPRWRLNRQYLIPFMRGTGLSRHVTRMLSIPVWQRPLFVLLFGLSDLQKLIWHLLCYRQRSFTDLVATCETHFLVACLMSPWYIWGRLVLRRQKKA